jgi:hypothetical protein
MKTHTILLLAICAGLAAAPETRAQTTFTEITTGPIATDQGSFGGASPAQRSVRAGAREAISYQLNQNSTL